MTATAPGVIGSILVRWRRKVFTLHTLGKVEERVPGTIFSTGFDVGFTPFLCDAPYQLKPLVNIHTFILSLTPFGWFISTYFFSYGNNIFYLRPLFQEQS
jgi:hypothetical protein